MPRHPLFTWVKGFKSIQRQGDKINARGKTTYSEASETNPWTRNDNKPAKQTPQPLIIPQDLSTITSEEKVVSVQPTTTETITGQTDNKGTSNDQTETVTGGGEHRDPDMRNN